MVDRVKQALASKQVRSGTGSPGGQVALGEEFGDPGTNVKHKCMRLCAGWVLTGYMILSLLPTYHYGGRYGIDHRIFNHLGVEGSENYDPAAVYSCCPA